MAAYFWSLAPFVVLLSGNFSPYRIGPILPIFLLITFFVAAKVKQVFFVLCREKKLALYLIIFVLYSFSSAFVNIYGFDIQGDEYKGAIDPFFYSSMGILRYILVFAFALVVTRLYTTPDRRIYYSVLTLYSLLFVGLVLQVLSHYFLNINFGYMFYVQDIVRYGGMIGEPQTLSAWIFLSFMFLYAYNDELRSNHFWSKFFLLSSIFIALLLTQSTAWLLAFLVWILAHVRLSLSSYFLTGFLLIIVIWFFGQDVANKIDYDLLRISERSITIVAGYELFTKDISGMLFGYGPTLSSYVLLNTEIFGEYPVFNLSDMGRQNVMNPYLEILFEFGVLGAIIFLVVFFKVFGINSRKKLVALLPIFLGIFGVGSAFVSAYFVLLVPLIVNTLNKTPK